MKGFKKITQTGLALTLSLTMLSAAAFAFGPGGGGSGFGGASGRGMTLITGKVVCTACDLTEVRQGQPDLLQLYQLKHTQGQVVMQIKTIGGSTVWQLSESLEFSVRAKDSVFARLAAEENIMKEIEITSVLSKDRRHLDIFDVAIQG